MSTLVHFNWVAYDTHTRGCCVHEGRMDIDSKRIHLMCFYLPLKLPHTCQCDITYTVNQTLLCGTIENDGMHNAMGRVHIYIFYTLLT